MKTLQAYVLHAQKGEEDAFAELVRRFQDMAVGYAYTLVDDFHLAEDVAQNAFVVAFDELNKLKDAAAFPGWFRNIVFTQCQRMKRKDKSFRIVSLDQAPHLMVSDPNPMELMAQKERVDMLHRAMDALPERYAEVTTLYYFSDYSQKEIAAFLEVPLTTVEKRLQYARKKLKKGMIDMTKDHLQSKRVSQFETFTDQVMNQLGIRRVNDQDVSTIGHLMREGVNLQAGHVWPYADSKDYITNTMQNNPEGCFLGVVDNVPVGYISTHITGRVGFVGGIGVDREYRRRGYGEVLLHKAVSYLSERCDVVGTTVPSNARGALNLFYQAGFRETLPARQMERGRQTQGNSKSVSAHLKLGSQLKVDKYDFVVAEIGKWTTQIYSGLDFSNDIRFFLHTYPDYILFYFKNNKPCGFLAVHDDYLGGEVWGAVKPGVDDEAILEALIREDHLIDLGGMFRFQTTCHRLTDIFTQCGFHILDDNTSMILKSHQTGWVEQTKSALLLQCWSTA